MVFEAFGGPAATAFARDLARFILHELTGSLDKRDAKFAVRAEKVMVAAARRLQDFKKDHRLNPFGRSRMANAFLWALKDGGCPADYADELTEWFTMRL